MRVVEIFQSIQGEGLFAGMPASFVRLAGCNLHCSFCDTDHSVWKERSAEEIRNLCQPNLPVVITGGEPGMHQLEELFYLLKNDGLRIHIETNGTHELTNNAINWISVSPKKNTRIKVKNADEVKWLIPHWSYEEIDWDLSGLHFIQPVNYKTRLNKKNVDACVDLLKRARPPKPLRLSVQLQKLIGVR